MTGQPLLLGIDVGTTLTKAGVVGIDGREIVQSAVPTIWRRVPSGGHADPDALFASVVEAARDVVEKAPVGEFLAVGVTSMAETAILMDASSRSIGPAVAWFDTRASSELAAMRRDLDAVTIGRTTGLGTSQIPTVAMLRWLAEHVDGAKGAEGIACVAEWIVHRLGGDLAAEGSLASRTGALDLSTGEWWPTALSWSKISPAAFPELRSAGSVWGKVAGVPPGLGRLEGALLTVGGHDHLCAAVGIGARESNQVMDSCGTAEAIVRAVPADSSRDFGAGLPLGIEIGQHVRRGHHVLIGGLALGLRLGPVLDSLGSSSNHGCTDLDELALALVDVESLAAIETGSPQSLREWSPVVDGHERSRDNQRTVDRSEAAATWRSAVATAVAGARRLLDGVEALGGPVDEVLTSGGWSRNPLLRRLKAEAFPPMTYPVVAEAGIRGAALLAGLAAEVFGDVTDFPSPELEVVR